MTRRSHFSLAVAAFASLLMLATGASADTVTFSNVRATAFTPGVTSVDLFSNPGVTFLTDDPTIVISVLTSGSLPPGATDTLRLTLTGAGEGGPLLIVRDLQLPDPNFPGDPINDVIRQADFLVPLTYQGMTFSLTVDILGNPADFVIPGGPNAGQRVDSYTYTFNVARPVPEPATAVLLASGLAGLAAGARRRRLRSRARG